MTDRAAFEAAMRARGWNDYDLKWVELDPGEWDYDTVEPRLAWSVWQEAARQEREACAKVCDDMSEQYRDAYKGRTEPIDRAALYNPHTDGMSDGACECAHEIRERSHPS